MDVCPKNALNFNVDNVRVAKIVGSSLHENQVVQGMVLRRDCEGTVKHAKDAKVAVFGCAVDTSATETKGTVLITSAKDLESYSVGEEQKMEEYIKMIADSGATVVVSGQSFGEMAMHFIERYGLMAIKLPSKFELRRFCRAVNATGIIKLGRPAADELGYVSSIDVREIGGTKCVVVQQNDATSRVATVVLRGSTENAMDDVERAVDDGVNAYKALAKDSRVVPAGGATEMELAHRLAAFGRKQTGLDQYAIEKFARALEVVPRTLAENAGLSATDVVYNLYAAHAAGRDLRRRRARRHRGEAVGRAERDGRHRGRLPRQVVGAQAGGGGGHHRPPRGPDHHGEAGGRAQGRRAGGGVKRREATFLRARIIKKRSERRRDAKRRASVVVGERRRRASARTIGSRGDSRATGM